MGSWNISWIGLVISLAKGLGNQQLICLIPRIWLPLITGPIPFGLLPMIYLEVGIGLSESRTGNPYQIAIGRRL